MKINKGITYYNAVRYDDVLLINTEIISKLCIYIIGIMYYITSL